MTAAGAWNVRIKGAPETFLRILQTAARGRKIEKNGGKQNDIVHHTTATVVPLNVREQLSRGGSFFLPFPSEIKNVTSNDDDAGDTAIERSVWMWNIL